MSTDRDETPDDGADPAPRPRARPRQRPPEPQRVSVLGILSLIEGIGALVVSFIPCFGFVGIGAGAVGLILGIIGWQLAKNSNGRTGTSLPIAGTITSGVAVAIALGWMLTIGNGLGGLGLFGKRAPRNDGPPVVLTATELATAYDDDADAADKLYMRRTVEVTGVIRRAQLPGLDSLSVRLVGTWATDVDCRFDSRLLGPAGADEVRALQEGQEITVRGTNRGDSLWVTVDDCMVLRAGPKPKPKDEPKVDPRPDPDPIVRPKPKPQPKEPPIPLTAEELQRAYDQNAIGADAKYKDKALDLTGKVARVVRGGFNTATVELVGDRGNEIDCRFAGNLNALAQLAPGDTVVIRGACLGEDDGTVTLDDCTLLKTLPRPALGRPTVVALDELRKAYEGNVIAADAKYKGKHIEVTGTALRVNPPRQGKIVLELGTEDRFALLCEFPASAKAALETVEAGGSVTLRGVCRGGDDGLVVFEDCALVRATGKQPKALELAPPPRAK